jgi:hypothetical protein
MKLGERVRARRYTLNEEVISLHSLREYITESYPVHQLRQYQDFLGQILRLKRDPP